MCALQHDANSPPARRTCQSRELSDGARHSVPPLLAGTEPQTYRSSRAVCETVRRGSAWQGPVPRPGSRSPISDRGWQRSSRSTIPTCAFVLGPFVLCFFALCSFVLCPCAPCVCLQSSARHLRRHLIADEPWS